MISLSSTFLTIPFRAFTVFSLYSTSLHLFLTDNCARWSDVMLRDREDVWSSVLWVSLGNSLLKKNIIIIYKYNKHTMGYSILLTLRIPLHIYLMPHEIFGYVIAKCFIDFNHSTHPDLPIMYRSLHTIWIVWSWYIKFNQERSSSPPLHQEYSLHTLYTIIILLCIINTFNYWAQ